EVELTEGEINDLDFLPHRIHNLQSVIVPQLFGTNSSSAVSSFIETILFIIQYLDDVFTLERLDNANLLPRNMTRKIKSMEARLNKAAPDIESLESKIKKINDAHIAAENIPVDLEELRSYNKQAVELKDKINKSTFNLGVLEENGRSILEKLEQQNIEAAKYLAMCEEAIRASTSKGLAGAFEIKADKLNKSIQLWVFGLAGALSAGGYVGFERLKVLSDVLNNSNPNTVVIITQLLLSFFSIGAPLWFAWLSTKQINQRFKLAEDYAFKASVAKAYEGYRNEASKVSNGEFEKRLFDSALSRLEEAPLRFVKDDDHATPWNELLNSKSFNKFLDASIENVNFVKGLISKKTQENRVASNDSVVHPEKKAE
ncbi:hypothetical protein, partial [Lelliottia amnigena]|uniref:hypothetical protein n=1 Tax=Lelliottia amnigena TaxID=61646 RepID=UPI0013F15403